MARPSFKATKDQRKLVHSLSAIGVPQEDIAVVIGIRSPKTLRKHFGKDIARGTAEATATITAAAYAMACSGKFPAMTRFWLSTVGRGAIPLDMAASLAPGRDQEMESGDAGEELSTD